MVLIKTGQFLLLIAIVLSTGLSSYSQTPADKEKKEIRTQIISTVLQRINKHHYNMPSLDDAYSAFFWKKFIQTLDPNQTTFLETDIQKMAQYENVLDDQLREGNTAFFDTIHALYRLRMTENREIADKVLSRPVSFDKKEEFKIPNGNQLRFPKNKVDKKNLWIKFLRYRVLKKYVELRTTQDSLLQKGVVDMATEFKAREAVRKWLNEQFRQSFKAGAEDDKFAIYMNTALKAIDPHTSYRGPIDNSLKDRLHNRYFGLGIELEERDAEFFVKRLMPGGAALNSKQVNESDRILAISDNSGKMTSLKGLTSNEVAAMIRGDRDSEVRLKLQHDEDQPRVVSLIRGEIVNLENKAKPAIFKVNGKKYGYIHLPVFYMDPKGGINGAASDVGFHLRRLMQEGIDGVVIDLRGNGGGSLDEVVLLASYFLPPGPITCLRSKTGVTEHLVKFKEPVYKGPLIVMVDEASASASEIFAAVIQDSKRGIVVGSNTYGKGTAQINMNVGKIGDSSKNIPHINYGSVTLTTQKFYRISGTSTQLRGVIPDVIFQTRMRRNIFLEKDYPNAMNYDTIQLPAAHHYHRSTVINQVIENAKRRVAANSIFKSIEENMKQLELLTRKPVPLELQAYYHFYKNIDAREKNIEELKKLRPEETLLVDFPGISYIAPDQRNEMPGYNPRFLRQLSEDVYLKESVRILTDLNTSKNN